MARELKVLTPENVPLHLELAGLGTRFAALFIDLAILVSGLVVIAVAGIAMITTLSTVGMEDAATAVVVLTVFVVFFGYFIFFETFWNGQTPGKRMLGLRVVGDGGFPITVFSAATRNLIRIVDFLPGFFGVGAIAVFVNAEHKRLGDLAAGTVVIRERSSEQLKYGPEGQPSPGALRLDSLTLLPEVRDPAEVLTGPELALMRRFTLQRWRMRPDDAERFAYRLIAPMAGRLNIPFPPGAPPPCYADLVTVLVREADRPHGA